MDRIKFLVEQLERDNTNPFLHFALAQEFANSGQWQNAETKYMYLLKEFPHYVGTYYHAAKLKVQKEELVQAAEILKKGMEIAKIQNDSHSFREMKEALFFLEEEE